MKLTARAEQVLDYLQGRKDASPRDALLDIDINSGSFTRRITELRDAGYPITVESRRHPQTDRLYRVYAFDWSAFNSIPVERRLETDQEEMEL